MDPERETLFGDDAELALVEKVPTVKTTRRRVGVVAAVVAAALLVAGAVSVAGREAAVSSGMDSLVVKAADAKCDTSACSDNELTSLCAGKLRVKCCTDDGGDAETCCLKEGKTNPTIFTSSLCSSYCDTDTPCKDAADDLKTNCKGVEKVKCCARGSSRIECCDKDDTPEEIKKGPYCRPKCDPDRVCQGASGQAAQDCVAKELKKCQDNKTCAINQPAKGISCQKSGCCQDPNMACYEKNDEWAECRGTCTPGNQSDDFKKWAGPWTCRVLGGGCNAKWEGCLQSRCCRGGFQCYIKNPHWAQCRRVGSCKPGVHAEDREHPTPWACKVITPNTKPENMTWKALGLHNDSDAEDAGCAAAWAGCLAHKCCQSPPGKKFVCYAKNPHWAQCREEGNCAKGKHTEDPVEHRTDWACQAINKSTTKLTWEGLGLKKPEDAEGANKTDTDSDKPGTE